MASGPLFEDVRGEQQGFRPASHEEEKFRVEIDLDHGATRVAPVGELDLGTVEQLDGALQRVLDGGCRHLVLDLRRLTFIDSTGLRLVLRWNGISAERVVAFAVIQGGPNVRRLFEIVGLLDRLPFVESAADGTATSAGDTGLERPRGRVPA